MSAVGATEVITGTGISPDELRHHEFATVRRGADPVEVAFFLRKAAASLQQAQEEKAALQDEVWRLQHAETQAANVEFQAVSILTNAQRNADQVVADAQAHARQLTDDARQRRDAILADGASKANGILRSALDEAGREAARLVAEAPIDAQRQLAYYQSLAQSIRTQMEGYLAGLSRSIQQWETDERFQAQTLAPDNGSQQ